MQFRIVARAAPGMLGLVRIFAHARQDFRLARSGLRVADLIQACVVNLARRHFRLVRRRGSSWAVGRQACSGCSWRRTQSDRQFGTIPGMGRSVRRWWPLTQSRTSIGSVLAIVGFMPTSFPNITSAVKGNALTRLRTVTRLRSHLSALTRLSGQRRRQCQRQRQCRRGRQCQRAPRAMKVYPQPAVANLHPAARPVVVLMEDHPCRLLGNR